MYRKKNREKQMAEVKISLEAPVSDILQAIDKAINFSFIYEEVDGLQIVAVE